VRIALTLAALNYLDVMTGDIENAYLTAPITEKVWTVLGPEFGDDAAAFRNHLACCIDHLKWKTCITDRHLWMK
jgi:hypothetical protein